MTLWLAAVAALAAAFATAAALARRASEHRPVVALLAVGLACDLAVEGIRHVLTRPLAGADVALYHASNAMVTAWPAGLALAAWWAFSGQEGARARASSWRVVVGLWALANALFVGAVPRHRDAVQAALLAVEVASLIGTALAVASAWGRPWSWPHRALLWLAAIELVVVMLGPFRFSIYERWDLARVAYTIGFAVLAALQGATWYRLRPQQAGSGR